jgi:hypothetical protein
MDEKLEEVTEVKAEVAEVKVEVRNISNMLGQILARIEQRPID